MKRRIVMTIDIPQDVKDRIQSEWITSEWRKGVGIQRKEPYTMDQAIYCKLKEKGIETQKAVEITVSLEKMLRDCFPNGKDTHLTEEEL